MNGLYNNASEVVREALRFMETHDELVYEMKLARLREQLSVGVGQLERGEGVQLDSSSAVDGFFGHITRQDR